MFCTIQKPYLLILANLQISLDFSSTCISLNVKFSFPTKNLESFTHFLAFSIILYKELKNVGLFAQVTAYNKYCVTDVVERNLSQSQILKGIQDKNTVVPKDFFDDFRDEMMGYKGELGLML